MTAANDTAPPAPATVAQAPRVPMWAPLLAMGVLLNPWLMGVVLTPAGSLQGRQFVFFLVLSLAGIIAAIIVRVRFPHASAAKLLLAMGAALVAFVIAELFIAWMLASADTPRNFRELDDTLGWKTRANVQWRGELPAYGLVDYSTQPAGFRRFDEPDSSRARFFAIGDSYTQAQEVSDGAEWFSHAALNANATVCAYGAGGYGSLQELMVLREHLAGVAPTHIIWQLCPNDIINNSYDLESRSHHNNNHMRRPYWIGGAIEHRFPRPLNDARYRLAQWSTIFRLVDIRIWNARTSHSVDNRLVSGSDELAKGLAIFRDLARQFRQTAGPVPVFAFTADPWLAEEMQAIVEEEGITFIPVHLAMTEAAARGEKIDFQPHDTHWNARGHQIAGEAVSQFLADHALDQ